MVFFLGSEPYSPRRTGGRSTSWPSRFCLPSGTTWTLKRVSSRRGLISYGTPQARERRRDDSAPDALRLELSLEPGPHAVDCVRES